MNPAVALVGKLLPILSIAGVPPKLTQAIGVGIAAFEVADLAVDHLSEFVQRNGRMPTPAEWDAAVAERADLLAEFERIAAAKGG